MLFDHHEPLSPGLQAILLLAEDEDLLGLRASEETIRREIQGSRHGCYRFQGDE